MMQFSALTVIARFAAEVSKENKKALDNEKRLKDKNNNNKKKDSLRKNHALTYLKLKSEWKQQ
jgi:hypothetical protein